MEKDQEPIYYWPVPKQLARDLILDPDASQNGISPRMLFLACEIRSFEDNGRNCFADNDWLGEQIGSTNSDHVSHMLHLLIKEEIVIRSTIKGTRYLWTRWPYETNKPIGLFYVNPRGKITWKEVSKPKLLRKSIVPAVQPN